MNWPHFLKLDVACHTLAQALFLRALGIVYFLAFISLLKEAKGLYGQNGLLPIWAYMKVHRPISLFRWLSSDFFISFLCLIGLLLSLLLIIGLVKPFVLLGLVLIYLSFVTVGQNFLSFQWDALLLEVSYIAFFFLLQTPPSPFLLIALWVLLFRLIFSSGVVKLISGDKNWQNLTALQYHYQTQPLPNRIAWHIHHFPPFFHKISTLLLFAVELVMPFLIFGTQPLQSIAFLAIAGLQIILMLTGNFSFLNFLTIALCIPLLSNSSLEILKPFLSITETTYPIWTGYVLDAIGLFFILINIAQLFRLFIRSRWLSLFLHVLSPLRMTSPYGLFAVMTTRRIELVIQGSHDGHHFIPYDFRYKPQNLFKPPCQIAPFHPRLDWQMWFAALHAEYTEPWLNNLVTALLHQNQDVIKLLKTNPFSENPPRYVRIDIYEYTFCKPIIHQQTGQWWERKLLAIGHPMELR